MACILPLEARKLMRYAAGLPSLETDSCMRPHWACMMCFFW